MQRADVGELTRRFAVYVQDEPAAMSFESKASDVAVWGNGSRFTHTTESPTLIVRVFG